MHTSCLPVVTPCVLSWQDEAEQEAVLLAQCGLVTRSRQQQLTLLEAKGAKGQMAAAQASLAEALVQEEAACKRRGAALASAQNMQRCLQPHLEQLMKLVSAFSLHSCLQAVMHWWWYASLESCTYTSSVPEVMPSHKSVSVHTHTAMLWCVLEVFYLSKYAFIETSHPFFRRPS